MPIFTIGHAIIAGSFFGSDCCRIFNNFEDIELAKRDLKKQVYQEYWKARRERKPIDTRSLAAKYKIGKSTIQRICNDHESFKYTLNNAE